MIQIKALPIPGGVLGTLNPVAIWDRQELVLVDTGIPGSLEALQAAATREDVPLERLTRIILTHHDYDHMGALAALRRAHPSAQVIASRAETPYIQGELLSPRMKEARESYLSYPQAQRDYVFPAYKQLEGLEFAPVDLPVEGGATLPFCGGVELIPTPGHLPGHLSVYLPREQTLIPGDAMMYHKGRAYLSLPRFTLDMTQARRSVERLRECPIRRILFYHGGDYTGDVERLFRQMLEED